MNSRIQDPPPATTPKKFDFTVISHHPGGKRTSAGLAAVIQGETDLANVLINSLTSMREENSFPDGTHRIEVEIKEITD